MLSLKSLASLWRLCWCGTTKVVEGYLTSTVFVLKAILGVETPDTLGDSDKCQGKVDYDLPLPEVADRVHTAWKGQGRTIPLDVLWTRKSAENSPLAKHITAVKEGQYGTGSIAPYREGWTYKPALGVSELLGPEGQSGRFSKWSRELVEMTENGISVLREIMRFRENADMSDTTLRKSSKVWTQKVIIGEDRVGDILRKAREGANGNHSTKSKVVCCPSPAYTEVMDEFGLRGVAAYPVFLGSWWMALLLHDFDDWRLDYLCILDYSYFFEYNVDSARIMSQSPSSLKKEIMAVWDMPELPEELRVRRSHMVCDMAFFELKRAHEASVRAQTTDGLTAWVHADRDTWRDFKAVDAGGFAHFLSFVAGIPGRDDMMLSGLVNDWVDLGPDLRFEECNQSVFALTRGSLALADMLSCYERTVWMLNASFDSKERHVGFMTIAGACIWELCNHRQDVWRYYSLAFNLSSSVQALNLYKIGDLAECYTSNLEPKLLSTAKELDIPRRNQSYRVSVDGTEYTGTIMLHTTVCNAVESGILPESIINYQIVLPLLLRRGEIDANTFLSHMDRHYCTHAAEITRSGHANDFSYQYGRAIAALVMEEWWSGLYFIIGVGSLIEAQPGHIAGDRPH
ncbi:hypothetical protein BDV38DRAFT_285907 [Aspergillus pseudotamarii]|uniref:Six-hairpin glycosidase-like protein n=1 Tax=Aspergillus pseudotamarii TaxID=132259 RepID=A0A5N6SID1_ASPPS|nr:uncharacterized protein BDV38DRAFT_285907 [Aspergillus pseudotamarii]KAE8134442.1 hypothetical protein BDV38DRAFT_285907 [Aspergillus pseudotamarii]